ncbi:MAG: carboxymethylenebutenolidase [Sphingobacteriales bacterium 17-39-43]|uniref:dienelactone hydrolase family protein n=1 Tax=Daejeonella sp. TaxID=2805397 RepID=UPI000BD1865C|nr:dienelactone hydrolase family protein [Daejeonella sp.]OYZ33089.1 MAG: carboxymethylenebutenolidase [Sphingobacteriales bacterium 16-39-50]OZA26498.1 MAG: carboxymethylenebutenolidase [Sphingobacteriales bacterium 17-39-43]HQT21643.1 dienelactone hydrolase family protein [Daejeonella sp.]HQT56374.1 dienelactone hydrolase family protein [Daejeonella sp.]
MDQKIINLYDEYTHKPLSRKSFMNRLVKLTGSAAMAMTALSVLEVGYANAETVSKQDEDLILEDISYPGDDCTMKGYLARPKGRGKFGSVVVIHENRGLNPHIKDIARRVAKAGFIALAPDALSPFGGTPANTDDARGMFSKIDASKNLNNFLNALDYLKSRKESNGKTACVGFCWGGRMTNLLAVNSASLNAAVAYYGGQPDAADVPKIKAKLMLHYAGMDERVNAGIPAYEAALKSSVIDYQLFIYDGVQHAFNNDTGGERYNADAAKLAWGRTLELFNKTIK